MRILSLCLSPDRGGLEIYAYQSMQWLLQVGLLEMVVVHPTTPLNDWVQAENVNVQTLEAKGSWPFKAARSLARTIENNRIDAVHINWGRDLNLAVLAKYLSKQDVALVYSRHMRLPYRKRNPYHRWIYKQVDRLIVTTGEMYDQALQNLPLEHTRVHHLYLGVQPPKPADSNEWEGLLAEVDLTPNRFTVGLFGRVEHEKGQHVLIDAIRNVVDSGCDVQALIVGQPMTAAFYNGLQQQIAEQRLENRIGLHGFITNANRFMHYCDVVVLTSYCEHFGLVLIEAMHNGVPVVGTAAGGVPEIIENGVSGLLCQPGDANDLAEQIVRLYNNPAVSDTLASNGLNRAREIFSETRHFESLAKHLRDTVLHKKNRFQEHNT